MGRDLCGEYVGPMPFDLFMTEFVPDRTQGAVPPVDLNTKTFFARVPTTAGPVPKATWNIALGAETVYHHSTDKTDTVHEKDMYQPFVRAPVPLLWKFPRSGLRLRRENACRAF